MEAKRCTSRTELLCLTSHQRRTSQGRIGQDRSFHQMLARSTCYHQFEPVSLMVVAFVMVQVDRNAILTYFGKWHQTMWLFKMARTRPADGHQSRWRTFWRSKTKAGRSPSRETNRFCEQVKIDDVPCSMYWLLTWVEGDVLRAACWVLGYLTSNRRRKRFFCVCRRHFYHMRVTTLTCYRRHRSEITPKATGFHRIEPAIAYLKTAWVMWFIR